MSKGLGVRKLIEWIPHVEPDIEWEEENSKMCQAFRVRKEEADKWKYGPQDDLVVIVPAAKPEFNSCNSHLFSSSKSHQWADKRYPFL